MQEQRQTIRNNAFVGGQIVFSDQRSALFCLVRDISDQGARLELSNVAGIPEQFGLHVNGRTGQLRARVIWRGSNDLGVAFEAQQPVVDHVLPQAS